MKNRGQLSDRDVALRCLRQDIEWLINGELTVEQFEDFVVAPLMILKRCQPRCSELNTAKEDAA